MPGKNRRYFTVVGIYRDNNQVWMTFTWAFSPADAAETALREMAKIAGSGDPAVCDVIVGRHKGQLKNGHLVQLDPAIGKLKELPNE